MTLLISCLPLSGVTAISFHCITGKNFLLLYLDRGVVVGQLIKAAHCDVTMKKNIVGSIFPDSSAAIVFQNSGLGVLCFWLEGLDSFCLRHITLGRGSNAKFDDPTLRYHYVTSQWHSITLQQGNEKLNDVSLHELDWNVWNIFDEVLITVLRTCTAAKLDAIMLVLQVFKTSRQFEVLEYMRQK